MTTFLQLSVLIQKPRSSLQHCNSISFFLFKKQVIKVVILQYFLLHTKQEQQVVEEQEILWTL